MAKRTIGLSDELHAYVVAHSAAPDPLVAELIAETQAVLPDVAQLQIAPEQAPFMTLMTQIVGVQNAVEIGTFTGLSALAIARGLEPGGKLICCDISAEYTSIAQRYWARAGLADRIDLRIGPAIETLRAMPSEPHVDLAFIDADKTGYPDYWAEIVPRMRPGGVILIDNVLRGGRIVLPPTNADDATMAEFNDIVTADKRVTSMIVPIADGVTLARKN
ncbi:MAG TPA: O-methyltransferase [Micromonosporaceae bacterium]|jgi:caffeoyl-CoA O-methyltransferase